MATSARDRKRQQRERDARRDSAAIASVDPREAGRHLRDAVDLLRAIGIEPPSNEPSAYDSEADRMSAMDRFLRAAERAQLVAAKRRALIPAAEHQAEVGRIAGIVRRVCDQAPLLAERLGLSGVELDTARQIATKVGGAIRREVLDLELAG